MEIRRKFQPGMKVRKFHNGGKGPGHPHKGFVGYPTDTDSELVPEGWSETHGTPDEITTQIVDSILSSSVDSPSFKFSEFRDLVGSHEGGIGGYSAHQIGGGPGRGRYQFDEESARTAYNRLKTIASNRGYSIPKLTNEDFKNMDKVSPEIQDLLFTANIAKSPDTSIDTILSDKSQWDNQWAVGHWRGKKEDLATRLASFKHTRENMPSDNNDNSTVEPENINSLFFGSFPTEQNTLGSTLTLPQKIYND